jgi:hypothetical protein
MVAVTLIGKSNGVGLARDLRLLADVLAQCGCNVQVHAAQRRDGRQRRSLAVQTLARVRAWLRSRFSRRARHVRPVPGAAAVAVAAPAPPLHVNLMLEHVWPQFLHTADLNIAVPNPEWFDRRDRRLLATLDGIWAKTHQTQTLFNQLGCRTAFIGFDSEDRYQAGVARERSFFHLAGKSQMKGTEPLLRLWQRHPEWPTLVVLYHVAGGREMPSAANIRWYRDYLPDEELRVLQNRSRFHLCLSEAEGWGHYIVEALSVGAVTLTLDAAPMNELVQSDRGVLVSCTRRGRQHLADTVGFDDAALEGAVQHALALDEAQLARLGAAARAWFLDNRSGFAGRIGQALARLDGAGALHAGPGGAGPADVGPAGVERTDAGRVGTG